MRTKPLQSQTTKKMNVTSSDYYNNKQKNKKGMAKNVNECA